MLDKIDPAKLNETLGAISQAFNGRGEKFGQTLTDFNALLAKIEPSLPNLTHDIEASVPTCHRVRRCRPDLVSTIANTTTVSNTIVDEQRISTSSWSAQSVWPTSATRWSVATGRR